MLDEDLKAGDVLVANKGRTRNRACNEGEKDLDRGMGRRNLEEVAHR